MKNFTGSFKHFIVLGAVCALVATAGAVSLQEAGILGAADGALTKGVRRPSAKEVARREKAERRRGQESGNQAPGLNLGIDPNDLHASPIQVNEPLLEPYDPARCARNLTPLENGGVIHINGEVRRVGYTAELYNEDLDTALACSVGIYPPGCEGLTSAWVFASRDRDSRLGHMPGVSCEALERAMHNGSRVEVKGTVVQYGDAMLVRLLHFFVLPKL